MADETTRDRIRSAIEEWAEQWRHPHGTLLSALTDEEVADLVERIKRALRGEDVAPAGGQHPGEIGVTWEGRPGLN